ncbi:MAG: tetratricopeptide repeat protein [Prevotellaceae bacterium]|nr:tetratricopeptide repeat protein [Prevotellaceae bacterium]
MKFKHNISQKNKFNISTLKTKLTHIISIAVLLTAVVACSTKKNTWYSRNYQALNTRFNVNFNGYESYKEGLLKIAQNHKDDYSEPLLMYPISNHANASSAGGDMDRAEEKAKKAIKKHSIKKKPKKNPKKSKDPKYQAFMSQEEYNVMIDEAWLLMGKAEFHKADFLAAVGTFTYVIRHFSTNKEVTAEAQLWLARSYAEMGWHYEAEDILTKAGKDDFSKKQTVFFAAVNADLLLKEKQYSEAIPFLELAVKSEKNRKTRARWNYLLGQLYQMKGDNKTAYEKFRAAQKSNPPFEMAVNAKLKQSECYSGADKTEMLKMLNKMAKNDKYADYLDQIYSAKGNIYLNQKDTTQAIENYKLAIEKSTRNGYEKAQAMITLADLYYVRENYRDAQPLYADAVTLMNPQSEDFKRVTTLSETLTELITNLENVHLQDSLQALSRLPEKEKMAQIQKIIKRVIEEEKEAKRREEEERRLAEANYGRAADVGNTATNNLYALGENRGGSAFYFYNNQLLTAGKTDFQRRWGMRRLEDNWRRQVKTLMAQDMFADDEDETEEGKEELSDSIKALLDNKKPEFYLRQLFTTEEQFQKSDEEIIGSLYNAGFIYNDKISNIPKAVETFEELERRFPRNEKLPDIYFFLYQTYDRQGDVADASLYRDKLTSQFPDNKYARILSQPDYKEKLLRMAAEQDSLYESTYYAYLASDFTKVLDGYQYMEENYPASPLMPKFALLNTFSLAKTETPDTFKVALEDLVAKYPNSDVTSLAKDMLALLAQGQESQQGESHGSLIAAREKETEAAVADSIHFNIDKDETHYFVVYIPKNALDVNKLQYNIAVYNFSKFLIKTFDPSIRKYDEGDYLIVGELESLDEALWYQSGILQDKDIANQIADLTHFVVSKENFKLMLNIFSREEYIDYFNQNIAKNEAQRVGAKYFSPENEMPENETPENVSMPITETPIIETQPEIKETETPKQEETKPAEPTPAPAEPKKDQPKFRGLYTFDETVKHYFALYIMSGDIDFEKLKTDIGKYNTENYPLLNLQITQAESGKQKIILIGTLPDAASAKSYLLRIVKDKNLFTGIQGATYRNLIITQENLDTMNRIGNPNVYLDFLREKYLK